MRVCLTVFDGLSSLTIRVQQAENNSLSLTEIKGFQLPMVEDHSGDGYDNPSCSLNGLHTAGESSIKSAPGLYGQAGKRTWRMPWRQEAKKDVPVCEKLRGADRGR